MYTFAMLLAVYLVGTALGAAAYQRWLGGHAASGDVVGDPLLGALGAACLLGTVSLWAAESALLLSHRHASEPACRPPSRPKRSWRLLAFALPTLRDGRVVQSPEHRGASQRA